MISYEFIDDDGVGVLSGWALQRRQKKQLRRKLRMLAKIDRAGASGSIILHVGGGIWELEIKGPVQLRPRLCIGPPNAEEEATFLATATKKDNKLIPKNVDEIAASNWTELKHDPSRRKLWRTNEKN